MSHNTTYAQWEFYKLIEAAARQKAVSQKIIFSEWYFTAFVEQYFKHTTRTDSYTREVEVLEPFWPGISKVFNNDRRIVSTLTGIYQHRDQIKQALAEVEAETEAAQQDKPKIVMDITEGSRRIIITSDGIMTVEYTRFRRGVRQTVREEHSSSILLDMVIEKCGGANEEDI